MARKPKTVESKLIELPSMPPPTDEEIDAQRQLRKTMQETIVLLRQRNLNNAVALAQQAARGQGPLIDLFAEIGRRFGDTLNQPQSRRLGVIEGGKE